MAVSRLQHFPTLGFRKKLLLTAGILAVVIGILGQTNLVRTFANPLNGDITVDGTVQAAPPSQPAVITSPTNGQVITQSPTTVSGTCPGTDTIVEIYKNNVFTGSGPCQNGSFAITVDLFIGPNTLIAKVKDNLGQYGPDSVPVNVTYKPTTPTPTNPTGGSSGEGPALTPETQMILLIDADYRGSFPGERVTIQPSILGGVAPYAIKIEWGDGSEEIIARKVNGPFDVSHVYQTAGTKTIKIYASDSTGQKAYVQTVAIINGAVPVKEEPQTIVLTLRNWWWWFALVLILILGIILGVIISRRRHKDQQNDN
jgi:hypothetical protein